MGYTTEFTGAIELNRKLTMAEAKELLTISDVDATDAKSITGIDAYFQWTLADTMQHIVWDGNEKFYHYVEQLVWLCGDWLAKRDIQANGTLRWQGEETGDTGTITVVANRVVAQADELPAGKQMRPLTLRDLERLALEQVTTA